MGENEQIVSCRVVKTPKGHRAKDPRVSEDTKNPRFGSDLSVVGVTM